MDLPKLTDFNVSGKKVIVRLDLDLPEGDESRLEVSKQTLDYLKSKNAKIVVIGHRGRPEGKIDENLSLKFLQPFFDRWDAKLEENLRFDSGEERNDPEFAKKLAGLGDVYINEAFATSHRNHASIVGIPKFLPHGAGFRFIKEVENISKVFDDPKRPVIILISGVKEDKIQMAKKLSEIYDKVLVGGRLPEYMGEVSNDRLLIANLISDKEDITMNSIQKFKDEIAKAGTVVLAGVLGKYEDEGHHQGTKEIFAAVANSSAYKIAGGGDTEAALTIFGLTDKFDWISVGGGAMLEFLSNRTLPGIQALLG